MTRIALVVSDVDGTLLTKDKMLTDKAARAVRQLEDSGVGFTIVSSRPTIGMRFLVEPLRLTLPFGSFNGSSIIDPQMNPIEQHVIPASAAQRSLDILKQFGVDIWLFTNDQWFARQSRRRIQSVREAHHQGRSGHRRRFHAISVGRPARSSAPVPIRRCCSAAKPRCRRPSAHRPPRSARRPTISTSRRPATTRAPSSRRWPNGWAFRPMRSPPSATCRTISRCSKKRHVDRDGQRHRRDQAAGDQRHDVERGRGFCRRDRDGDEAERD